jgi:hypothetical protein
MTVAEFQQLPEPEAYYHELRHGELVKVTRPKLDHVIAQKRLLSMLDALDAGAAFTEFGFRPQPEYELRVADVALITKDRWATINPEKRSSAEGYPEGFETTGRWNQTRRTNQSRARSPLCCRMSG